VNFNGQLLLNVQNVYKNINEGSTLCQGLKISFAGDPSKAIVIRNEERSFTGLVMPSMIGF